MTCNECQQRIAEIGGADPLPDDVAAHVDSCDDCAEAVVAERHVRAVLVAAPWPDSSLAQDMSRLKARASAESAALSRSRRRRALGWVGGLGALAALAWVGTRVVLAGDGTAPITPALLFALFATCGVIWVGLDAAGRRLAASGASTATLVGLSAARAGVAVALMVALLHPAAQPALEDILWSISWRPAEAGTTAFEASLLCAGKADGRLRVTLWSEGCREHEREVPGGLGGAPGGAGGAAAMPYRAGSVTIPAGLNYAFIDFSQPMPTAEYHIAATVTDMGRPFAADDACRVVMVAGKSTEGFGIMFRRCWFDWVDVPADPAKNDLTLDWIAVEGR